MRSGIILLAVFAIAGCNRPTNHAPGASVTVQLPPPRPYTPGPAFSFGSAPRPQG